MLDNVGLGYMVLQTILGYRLHDVRQCYLVT